MTTLSQKFRSQEILAARALFAAESGAEIHLVKLLNPAGVSSCTTDAPYNFTTNGLLGCSYEASCAQVTINSIEYSTVESIGRCGSGTDSATRMVEVRVSR